MQKTTIIGRVGKDPEMRFTSSGQKVTSFSVAVSERYTNSADERVEKTIWYRVTAWGNQAETHNQYVKKGMLIYVEGRLNADENGNPRVYQKQDGTAGASFELTAISVEYLSKVEGNKQPAEPANDDVPF